MREQACLHPEAAVAQVDALLRLCRRRTLLCSNARSRRTASRPKQSKGQVIAVLPVVVRGELDIVLKGTPDGAERILVLGAQD